MPTQGSLIATYTKHLDLDPMEGTSKDKSTLAQNAAAYRASDELRLALNVALVTGRPLLLKGEPGCGKSTAAAFVALRNKWRYYQHIVTSRSDAQDLLYRFDNLRRLQDATSPTSTIKEPHEYVVPGDLWWAIDPVSAGSKGRVGGDPPPSDPTLFPSVGKAVLLIDEIDKADPDYPNNLLEPLGSSRFMIPELDNFEVSLERDAGKLLVIVTTNDERELPRPFLRRCVVHKIELPEDEEGLVDYLVSIAQSHAKTKALKPDRAQLFEGLARKVKSARDNALAANARAPSTAEYLDLVRACQQLEIDPKSESWSLVEGLVLRKWETVRSQ